MVCNKRKPVFIKRKWNHVVFSRVTILSFHPVVEEFELVQENPDYAFVRLPNGKESIVSLLLCSCRGRNDNFQTWIRIVSNSPKFSTGLFEILIWIRMYCTSPVSSDLTKEAEPGTVNSPSQNLIKASCYQTNPIRCSKYITKESKQVEINH